MKKEKIFTILVKYHMAILMWILIAMFLIQILGLFGVFGGNDACWFRYNIDSSDNNKASNDTYVSESIILNANGRYDIDPNHNSNDSYGKWVKAGAFMTKDNPVKINIEGEVSLCKSYLTAPNLQKDILPKDNLGNDKKIEIPRIGTSKSTGTTQDYVSLIFDSATLCLKPTI